MSKPARILLVDDAKDIHLVVTSALKSKYEVTIASNVAEAMHHIETGSFALIILDIGLPDGNGYQVCTQIRMNDKYKDSSIVFLTGNKDSANKIMGWSLGADDYIVKPIDPMEFQARIFARMRRLEENSHAKDSIVIGPFRVSQLQHKIFVTRGETEAELDLTHMEFKLLRYLLGHEKQTLSREQILNSVWGHLPNVTDRTIDTHIYTLRQKLDDFSTCIQAVPRVGYRFLSQPEAKKVAS